MKTPKNSITQKPGRLARLDRLALATLVALPTLAATAADLNWNGGTADYTNATDWVGAAVPGIADNAINDNGTNNAVEINIGDPDWTLNQITAGDGDGDGAFVQSGQTVTIKDITSPFRMGFAGSDTGIYTLNGGTINYTNGGGFYVGVLGTGILNINGGLINGNGNFAVNLGMGASPGAVTASMDGGPTLIGTTWFEQGADPAATAIGLPLAGSTITTNVLGSDHSYTFAPSYATNDTVMIDSNAATSATITLTPAAACSALSFLGSAGNGPVTVYYTVYHTDSTTETGSLTFLDWFNNTGTIVFGAGGRVNADGTAFGDFGVGNNPYLDAMDISLTDTTSPVTSIGLTLAAATNNGTACLMAVSGSTGGAFSPLAITGYNESMIMPAGAVTTVSSTITSTVNQTNGAVTVTGAGQMFVGNYGTGLYNLSGGSINVSNYIAIGRSGGNGTFNMTGGVLSQDGGGNLLVGTGFNAPSGGSAVGVLNQSGGAITCQGLFLCPESSPSSGTYNLGGTGTLTVNNTLEIGTAGDTGTLNQTGGSITNLSGQTWIGQGAGAVGTYNLSGGTFTASSWLAVGRTSGSGTINLTNGSITYHGPSSQHFDVGASGIGVLNQYGGVITNTTSDFWLGESSTATWNMNGGSATLGNLVFCVDSSASGALNLNGGLIQVSGITAGNSVAISTLNFNGGTLQANANNANFLSGLYQASVGPANAVIDSQGYNITIPQALVDNGGGVTKLGTGTLTLTGANTYSGNTAVNAGALLTGTGSSTPGNVTVADTAAFGVIVQSAGAQYTAANVTVGSSAGAALDFNLGGFGNPSLSQAPLVVNSGGLFTVNGTVTVNVADALAQLGEFPLVQYPSGGLAGTGNFVVGSLPVGVTANLVTNVSNNSIDLVITGINQPRWDGEAGGTWDTGSDTNWVNLGTGLPTTYTDPSPVIFNDSALGTTNVDLTTTVNPSTITVTNKVLNYAIVGSGSIGGSTGLSKQGSAALAILNTGGNSYTGPTVIGGGILSVTNLANGGSPSAIGASSASPTNLVLAGGTLSYGGSPVSINRGYQMTASSTVDAEGNLTLTGLGQATAGTYIKTGPGTLTYAGAGTNVLSVASGQFSAQVLNGTLVLGGSAGGQTNTEGGEMYVGSGTSSGTGTNGANLVLTNATLNCNTWFAIARGNGTSGSISTASLYNSILNCPGGLSLCFANGLSGYSANGVLNLNGNSEVIDGGAANICEANSGGNATVNVNGGSALIANGTTYIGNTLSKGVLNLNSTGTNTIGNNSGAVFRVGGGANSGDTGVGAINQSSGTLISGSNSVYLAIGIGGGAGCYGSINLSGGTFSRPNFGVRIGRSGLASFVQSGGTFVCGGEFSMASSAGFGNGVAAATFTGGSATINPGNGFRVPESSSFAATVNIGTEAGGNASVVTLFNSGFQLCYGGAAGAGTLNLDSGTLQLGGPISKVAGTGTGTVNLDGGKVQAGANNITLIDGTPSSVNVYAGGLMVDTMANTATISGNLLATTGNGVYPTGGTLIVPNNGGTGYIGAPLVAVSGGSGSGMQAVATISSGVVTNVIITCPGRNYLAGDSITFTFSGGGYSIPAGNFVHALQAGEVAANAGGGLTKIGSGTLYLNGASTYTGATAVSNGTLGGSGTVAGPVTVAPGATLAAGAGSIGTLTINNSLTFAAGSTSFMRITPSSNDQIAGLNGVTYNGALVVTNTGGALTIGHAYTLFNAAGTISNNFTSVTILPGGSYSGTFNPATGVLTIGSPTPPTVNPPMVSGGNLILTGSGGTPSAGYTWLTTTNLANAVSTWTTNTQGNFNGSGAFSNAIPIIFTNPAQFFRLRTP